MEIQAIPIGLRPAGGLNVSRTRISKLVRCGRILIIVGQKYAP